MKKSVAALFRCRLAGSLLSGSCGEHIARKIGMRGGEAVFLMGEGLAPIFFLCPAPSRLKLRVDALEVKVREFEERISGRAGS